MVITITSGIGTGKTPLSAFDAALKEAGVSNYNLIPLSSIIPPGSTIRIKKFTTPEEDYGNKLYVVKAEIRTRESGKYIGAAVGWYQLPDGRGIFVEHEKIGDTKKAVEYDLEEDVRNSLLDLCRSRKFPINEKNLKMKSAITKAKDSSASALVIAVYKAERWS